MSVPVGDGDVAAAVDGDAVRLLRELVVAADEREPADEGAVAAEHLDAVVAGIGDDEVAGRVIDGDVRRLVELQVAAAPLAKARQLRAARRVQADRVLRDVGDDEHARAGDRDAARPRERAPRRPTLAADVVHLDARVLLVGDRDPLAVRQRRHADRAHLAAADEADGVAGGVEQLQSAVGLRHDEPAVREQRHAAGEAELAQVLVKAEQQAAAEERPRHGPHLRTDDADQLVDVDRAVR